MTMRFLTFLALIAALLLAPGMTQAANETKPAVNSQTFGDWKLDCLKDKNAAVSDCQLMQKHFINGKDGKKKPLLLVQGALLTVKNKEGKSGQVLVFRMFTPLNTLLPAHLNVKLDSGKPMKLEFITCVPVGCMAEMPVNDALVEQLKKGNSLLVAYKSAHNGKQQNATVSLKGFTAAYDALKKG